MKGELKMKILRPEIVRAFFVAAMLTAALIGIRLREQSVLERYPWWQELRAVQNGNVAFANGNHFFNRSGMTVSQTPEIIADILHGISFGERTEDVHWRRSEANVARDLIRMGARRS
jgi:hypothetical protein